MCGIAVVVRSAGREFPPDALDRMTDMVAHRGPDGRGTEYLSLDAGAPWQVALGHRRLSIIDLSDAGLQPMHYPDRLWLTYNGEIYNYIELRRELERLGHVFRTQTDTEVILAAYDEWGPDSFRRLRGMWGLAIVDMPRRTVVLSRDRLGIKPLYVMHHPGVLAVASEIKQFGALPGPRLRPNQHAVRSYLATGYEDHSATFFAGVASVPAGTYQCIDIDALRLQEPQPYWFPERIEVEVTRREDAAEQLRATLGESVRLHMRSDVPVGCALSGGLDSSAVAGCVASLENGEGPKGALNTFSVVFPGDPLDERRFVDAMLAHIRANPHFVTPDPETFLADLDQFTWNHDEPVGSLSQYAGYALAKLTRGAGVPVTLNGQGGDEVLSGYWQSYFVHLKRLARPSSLPTLSRELVGAVLPGGNPELVRVAPRMLKRFLARWRAPATTRQHVNQAMEMTAREWRVYEIREWTLPRLLKWDDRNFMAFSVEGRYPFLDHAVIELCLSFSSQVLYDRGWTKQPLRRGLHGLLPEQILWRRSKIGFETPQGSWLAGPLMPLVEGVVAGESPAWDYVDPAAARELADLVRRRASREQQEALLRIVLLDRWLRVFQLS